MQRKIYALVLGAGLLGIAALAACGGGGGGTSSPIPAGITPGGAQLTANGSKFTFTINRTPVTKTHTHTQSSRRNAKASRAPEYINGDAQGLQIAVTVTGGAAATKYVDISSGSPLCNTIGDFETCTLTIPTLAVTESITVTEVDQMPAFEGIDGNPPGYGSGFLDGTNTLALGTGTSTTAGGATSLTLSLNPVLAQVHDANDCGGSEFASITSATASNAALDTDGGPGSDRIVVTAGVAQTLFDFFCFYDASGQQNYAGNTPQPVVDVNGSATPVTWISNSQHVLLALDNVNGSLPTPVPAATTVAMPDTSMLFAGNCISLILKLDGALTQPATVTISNNLSAINFWTGFSYAKSEVDTIVPLSVSAPSNALAQGAVTTATVTATDYKGTGGLLPFASVTNGIPAGPSNCVDGGGVARAGVSLTTGIDTTTWQQTFLITPNPTPTVTTPVTCTFVLGDVNTGGSGRPGYAVTPAVTVTINP